MSNSVREVIPFSPDPIQTVLVWNKDAEETLLLRRWEESVKGRCALCPICTLFVGQDGQGMCMVRVKGRIDPSSAATLSLRP